MRLLALGGVAGPTLFSFVVIVSAALQTDYSHRHDFISELGANGAPYANLMNYGGFIPGGVMLAAFGVALARTLPRHRLSIAASVFVTVFGCGILASGVASCDLGCPQTGGSSRTWCTRESRPSPF